MRCYLLIIIFLTLCKLVSYSQVNELMHLKDNAYFFKTYHFNSGTLESTLLENYADLNKDKDGVVRTVVLNLRNDTLAIVANNESGIIEEIRFLAGKRETGVIARPRVKIK